MALKGTVNTTKYDGRYYSVTWTATQSIASNTSTIQWTLKAVGGSASWYAERTLNLTIAGKSVFSKSARVERRTGTIDSGYVTVTHDASGNASFDIAIEGAVYTSAINVRGSGSFTLDAIARATIPSTDLKSVSFGYAVTISMPRASSTFTHTLKYTIGGNTGTIGTGLGTSHRWTVPFSLMSYIPNSTSGIITISCLTYDGSTLLGTKTVNITAVVPSDTEPVIESVTIQDTNSEIATKFGAYVMDKSGLKISITARGKYGASIVDYSTQFLGKNYSGRNVTVDTITSSGDLTAVITVKDSRGRTTKVEKTINVLPYRNPNLFQFEVMRGNDDWEPDEEGAWLLIYFGFNIYPLNDLNDKSYKLEIKRSSESAYTEIESGEVYNGGGGFHPYEANLDDSYNIRLTITDYFNSGTNAIVQEIEASPAYTLVDYHSSGKGISFGKVSEKANAMEIAFPMFDQYDTRIGNGVASYESGGSTDANTTLESTFISSKNTPDTGLWNVSQIFYAEKSETANRCQYAIPYAHTNSTGVMIRHKLSHYRRNYVDGLGWSDWIELPVLVESGTSGVWTYEKWSNGRARVIGKIPVSGITVEVALGAWYRSGAIYTGTDYQYPVTFSEDPTVSAQFFTSNTNGGLLWFLNNGTITTPPTCYLIRPVTSTGSNGYVHLIVEGSY